MKGNINSKNLTTKKNEARPAFTTGKLKMRNLRIKNIILIDIPPFICLKCLHIIFE